VLQKLLADAADKSLNCVTVDGDTSTSDTLLLGATGAARHAPIEEADDPVLVDFKRALDELLIDLAQLLARDGEGATKFVTINVGGASSNGAARKIGLSVANSPLVKTAIAGEDANWGRIVMAVGKSGERADRDKLRISIGGVKITDGGQVVPNYRRDAGRQAYEGHRRGDRHRSRHRPRPRHRVDLRSDARLHRHQRQLPFLRARA
jgi:N-acetylglutamate synthase (N-acetylornithine aminotransferase)